MHCRNDELLGSIGGQLDVGGNIESSNEDLGQTASDFRVVELARSNSQYRPGIAVRATVSSGELIDDGSPVPRTVPRWSGLKRDRDHATTLGTQTTTTTRTTTTEIDSRPMTSSITAQPPSLRRTSLVLDNRAHIDVPPQPVVSTVKPITPMLTTSIRVALPNPSDGLGSKSAITEPLRSKSAEMKSANVSARQGVVQKYSSGFVPIGGKSLPQDRVGAIERPVPRSPITYGGGRGSAFHPIRNSPQSASSPIYPQSSEADLHRANDELGDGSRTSTVAHPVSTCTSVSQGHVHTGTSCPCSHYMYIVLGIDIYYFALLAAQTQTHALTSRNTHTYRDA